MGTANKTPAKRAMIETKMIRIFFMVWGDEYNRFLTETHSPVIEVIKTGWKPVLL